MSEPVTEEKLETTISTPNNPAPQTTTTPSSGEEVMSNTPATTSSVPIPEPTQSEEVGVAQVASANEKSDENIEDAAKSPASPSSIRDLTIKNLDTGEEFVIGENDPDFEFDTFELTGEAKSPKDGGGDGDDNQDNGEDGTGDTGASPKDSNNETSHWRFPILSAIYSTIFKRSSTANSEGSGTGSKKTDGDANSAGNMISDRPRTPFTKLSSFKFKKELGRGAFGRVMLAEAKTDGKLYALKIISKANMRSSDKRQAKAERDILHSMAQKAPHPFTSGLKFAFQSENNLYLGMDYIPGGNLRELIKRFKTLPEEWVQFYSAELVLAISHLHSLNVLYRDIKPHNVMIDARGHMILIDFGLSKQEISHPRGALSLVGTPDYSAPEVLKTGVYQIEAHNREKKANEQKAAEEARNRRKLFGGTTKTPSEKTKDSAAAAIASNSKIGYGKSADWWSLGIMIYEMLAGTPAFRGADLRLTYQRILFADLEFTPEDRFSGPAKDLLTGLIERDPTKRLGAWDNPPRDIMNSTFFAGVDWDAVLQRKYDGPWIPKIEYTDRKMPINANIMNPNPSAQQPSSMMIGAEFNTKSSVMPLTGGMSTSMQGGAVTSHMSPTNAITNLTAGATTGGEQSQAEMSTSNAEDDEDDDDENDEGFGSATDSTNAAPANNDTTTTKPSSTAAPGGTAGQGGADDNRNNNTNQNATTEEDDDDGDGLLNMRDSIIIDSRLVKDKGVPDWSFIDEGVLMSATQGSAPAAGTEGATKKKKASKKKKAKSAIPEEK